MRPIKIIIDNTCDINKEFLTSNDIGVANLTFTLGGTTYPNDELDLSCKQLYDHMRRGELPITSMVNIFTCYELFKPLVKGGYDIIYLSFASTLSGSYNTALNAANELMAEFNDCNIKIIDTLAAGGAIAMLLKRTIEMINDNANIDDIYSEINIHKHKIVNLLYVDNLFHLCRGGRLSKSSAAVGSVLQLKPILLVNNNGIITPLMKIVGKKKAFQSIVQYMSNNYNKKDDTIMICHADDIISAHELGKLISLKFSNVNIEYYDLNPIIGAHTGPNSLCLFYSTDIRQ